MNNINDIPPINQDETIIYDDALDAYIAMNEEYLAETIEEVNNLEE